LRASDIFLLPSTNEGLPLSILEAQACRTAVIAAPTAGIPEVVRDNETGFLISAGDVEGYAAAIRRLLLEPDLAFRIVNQAHENVTRHFTWPVYFERLLHLYEEVLQNGRSRP
jgi:glycosyltransferase involved in cell wall biosynthesis